jgi:UDP-glucose 6-dehydrogenase
MHIKPFENIFAMKIGIIGKNAIQQLKCKDVDVLVYDMVPENSSPPFLAFNELVVCDVVFVCTGIEIAVSELRKLNYAGFIVLRSTVAVGKSDDLQCYFMPDFLTEDKQFYGNKEWIFGLLKTKRDPEFKFKMKQLIHLAHQNNRVQHNILLFLSNKESEMIKMFRNCFLALKVSFCNELSEFCFRREIDYETVRNIATNDTRITPSHSLVPGPDGRMGFGGSFIEDTASLHDEMIQSGMTSHIIQAMITRNELDRV